MPGLIMKKRGLITQDILNRASDEVMRVGLSVRSVAKSFKICHVTLYRYCKARKAMERQGNLSMPSTGYRSHFKVFTSEQEDILVKYLTKSADLYYGLCPKEVRKLAFQLANRYGCKHPQSWDRHKMAGKDWFRCFMARNKQLSIRRPEPTSLSRATGFNRFNVAAFFQNLATVLERPTKPFEAIHVWNMDETGITTVQAPERVVSRKGVKQLGAMVSAERGTLVTLAFAVNAQGNSIPPMFIFPRKKFQPFMINGGPPGCTGTANGSGWMQEEDFLVFLRHFVKHTRPTPEAKVILLLDNHGSHLSLEGIDYCRENGVVLLSFPPHCSHKLQPLDRTVYGPLKHYVNGAIDLWMTNNPGRTFGIYDVPGVVATALPFAASPANIMSGFRCSGIYPFNPQIFSDVDFAASSVTDRPDPSSVDAPLPAATQELELPSTSSHRISPVTPGPSHPGSPATLSQLPVEGEDDEPFSPVAVRPFPKAGPRKATTKGRKKRVTAILTDTPVKRALEEERHRNLAPRRLNMPTKGQKKKKATATSMRVSASRAVATTSTDDGTTSSTTSAEPSTATPKPFTAPSKMSIAGKPSTSTSNSCECQVCGEDFESSRPGEVWVQCIKCEEWAHEECTPGFPVYKCHNC